MRSFLWCFIEAQKAIMRVRIAWIDFWRWGARGRLRELDEWERRELADAWRQARERWRQQGSVAAPHDEP